MKQISSWLQLNILLLFVHVGKVKVDSFVIANLSECDTNSYAPRVAAGKLLELCCLLQGSICDQTLMNDSLTLTPCTKCSQSYMDRMSREGPCLVKYRIEQASLVDETDYHCQLNGRSLGNIHLQIIEVADVQIVNITCSPQMQINITLDINVKFARLAYNLEVVMMQEFKNVTLCQRSTNASVTAPEYMYQVNETLLICEHKPSYSYESPGAEPYFALIIKMSWPDVAPMEFDAGTFNIIQYIRPDPLTELVVWNVSATDVTFNFSISEDLQDVYLLMEWYKQPLMYHVRAVQTQGSSRELKVGIPLVTEQETGNQKLKIVHPAQNDLYQQFSFPSSVKMSGLQHFPHVSVHLASLTANTNYTLSVSASGGGGEGQRRTLAFSTAKSVPSKPPKVDSFNFMRKLASSTSGSSTVAVLLLWQPLTHDSKGGKDLTYSVELTDGLNFNYTWSNISQTYVHTLIENLPLGPLTAKFWAHNEIGTSANFSTLQIPASEDLYKPELIVESYYNKVYAYVSLPYTSDITYQQAALLWCLGYKNYDMNGIDICQDYTQTIVRPLNRTNGGIWEQEILLDKELQLQEVLEETTVFIKETGDNGSIFQYLTANVTMYKKAETEFNMSPRAHVVKEAEGNPYLRVFVSVQYENLWRDMTQAACYFDRTSDQVQLSLWPCADGQKKETVLVCFQQRCDSAQAQQFLVDHYDILVSQVQDCSEDGKPVETIKNFIFKNMMIEVPKSAKYVCVLAYRGQSGNQSAFYKSFSYAIAETDGTQVIIGVVVAGVLVSLTLVIIFSCYCHKRNGFFRKLELASRKVIDKNESIMSSPTLSAHRINSHINSSVKQPELTNRERFDIEEIGHSVTISTCSLSANVDFILLGGSAEESIQPTLLDNACFSHVVQNIDSKGYVADDIESKGYVAEDDSDSEQQKEFVRLGLSFHLNDLSNTG